MRSHMQVQMNISVIVKSALRLRYSYPGRSLKRASVVKVTDGKYPRIFGFHKSVSWFPVQSFCFVVLFRFSPLSRVYFKRSCMLPSIVTIQPSKFFRGLRDSALKRFRGHPFYGFPAKDEASHILARDSIDAWYRPRDWNAIRNPLFKKFTRTELARSLFGGSFCCH